MDSLDQAGTRLLPELGTGNIATSVELAVDTLWGHGLDEDLSKLSRCTRSLGTVGIFSGQALLLALFEKNARSSGILGSAPKETHIFVVRILDSVPVPFPGLVVCSVVRRLGHI